MLHLPVDRIRPWLRPVRSPVERWPSRRTYLAAACGFVVGMGVLTNPVGTAMRNGGGSFLIALVVAVVTVAWPVLSLAAGLGQWGQRALPRSVAQVAQRSRLVSWFAWLLGGITALLVAVPAIWAGRFALAYLAALVQPDAGLPGTRNPMATFQLLVHAMEPSADSLWRFPAWPVVYLLLGLFAVMALVLLGGNRVLGMMGKVMALLGGAGLLALTFRWTLWLADGGTGAPYGFEALLMPDWSALLEIDVWVQAYAHALLLLGLGLGVHTALGSALPRNADVVNSGSILALAGLGATILLMLVTAMASGILALSEGRPVEDVLTVEPVSGQYDLGVTFLTVPRALGASPGQSPSAHALWGVVWFGSLAVLMGFAAVALWHAFAVGLRQRVAWGRPLTAFVLTCVGIVLTIGLLGWTTWWWVGDALRFLRQIALPLAALGIVTALVFSPRFADLTAGLKRHSEAQIGITWRIRARYLAPIVLALILVRQLLQAQPWQSVSPVTALPSAVPWLVLIVFWAIARWLARRRHHRERRGRGTSRSSASLSLPD